MNNNRKDKNKNILTNNYSVKFNIILIKLNRKQ